MSRGRTFIWRQRLLFSSAMLLACSNSKEAVRVPLIHPNPSICWWRRFSIICQQWESARVTEGFGVSKFDGPHLSFRNSNSNSLAQIFGRFDNCCEDLPLCAKQFTFFPFMSRCTTWSVIFLHALFIFVMETHCGFWEAGTGLFKDGLQNRDEKDRHEVSLDCLDTVFEY
jgi:hypothetical protein